MGNKSLVKAFGITVKPHILRPRILQTSIVWKLFDITTQNCTTVQIVTQPQYGPNISLRIVK